MNDTKYLDYYLNLLGSKKIPYFLKKYLKCPSLLRLKRIGYFCGMDYASKDIYDFKELVSRYDHSLSVALITYKFTKNKKATIAGLFHDAATPCFSHVIDYMNNDFANQESTEEYTGKILKSDKLLKKCLKEDKLDIEDIIDFKKYSIVDNKRPKLCADRIDGVILTGINWTKNIELKDIKDIVSDLCVYTNEDKEMELGFKSLDVCKKVVDVSESIDIVCHSVEDNYMMVLLSELTKYVINNGYISYDDLYFFDEEYIFNIFESIEDKKFKEKYYKFKNITKKEVKELELPYIKKRDLNPLIKGKRYHLTSKI